MTKHSSEPIFFNEATFEQRLKNHAKFARSLMIAFFLFIVFGSIGISIATGTLAVITLVISVCMIVTVLTMPDRKFVRRGWPKPTIVCPQCHGLGWPEDLTTAQSCPNCDNDKLGRVNSKAA